MNINDNNTFKETNLNNKANNKKSYHSSTTPYKNYQYHNHYSKTPKDKFRPLGFSSPYHQSGNPETSCSTPYYNQYRNFQESNRQNFGYNRNNHNNNRNTQDAGSRDENISQYFHPSMLEDPWKKLEDQARKIKQKSPESIASNSSHSST